MRNVQYFNSDSNLTDTIESTVMNMSYDEVMNIINDDNTPNGLRTILQNIINGY